MHLDCLDGIDISNTDCYNVIVVHLPVDIARTKQQNQTQNKTKWIESIRCVPVLENDVYDRTTSQLIFATVCFVCVCVFAARKPLVIVTFAVVKLMLYIIYLWIRCFCFFT